jgi:hypothetical protein
VDGVGGAAAVVEGAVVVCLRVVAVTVDAVPSAGDAGRVTA